MWIIGSFSGFKFDAIQSPVIASLFYSNSESIPTICIGRKVGNTDYNRKEVKMKRHSRIFNYTSEFYRFICLYDFISALGFMSASERAYYYVSMYAVSKPKYICYLPMYLKQRKATCCIVFR